MARSFSARIKDGVIVPDDATLPEGTSVTIVVDDDDAQATFDLSPEEADELRRRIARSDQNGSHTIAADELLAQLANPR